MHWPLDLYRMVQSCTIDRVNSSVFMQFLHAFLLDVLDAHVHTTTRAGSVHVRMAVNDCMQVV
jgi:hypothetical protein